MLKRFAILVSALALFVLQSQSAFACGGLVAPNGAIRLQRATTLVAWHNGIEHYMTSFTYQGDVSNLGWIVPLPAVPIKIEEGGAWTLQRLFRETHPQPKFFLAEDQRKVKWSFRIGSLGDAPAFLERLDIEKTQG